MNKGYSGKVKAGALAVALLTAAGGTPVVLQQLADRGYDVPTLAPVEKVMALLDARSPGERTEGKLAQSKVSLKKLAENVGQPKERALGKIINPEKPTMADLAKVVAPPAQTVEVAPPVGPVALADVIPAPAQTTPGGVGGVTGTPLLLGGGGVGGGGGSPGGGGGDVPTQPPPAVVQSPVPEPSTWMLLLLGFGVIGSAARRERRSTAQRLSIS